MKIKRINETVYYEDVADVIQELITPFNEKLDLEKIRIYLNISSPQVMFKLYKELSDETYMDFMELFNIFSKYGLKWYKDSDDVIVDLDKYNDEMITHLSAKKYNI